ncbi:MAG: amino acid ABC transporter permease [Clostridiales bacterium]|nr:amino acid ABC transporter permease [Clostridiales bacterium]
MQLFWEVTQKLLSGFGLTCLLFILTLVLSLPLGLVFAFGSMSRTKPLRYLTRGFVYIIRGTPLLLQLMIVVYLPGIAFKMPITKWGIFGGNVELAYFCGALAAFVINYACYFSEIYRGGIENIPKGQYEAGQVLGMTRRQIFFKVVLLQVVKNILAPISNETITLVKDTALARCVAVAEIFFEANELLSLKNIIWPLFYTGAFYLVFNSLLTVLFNRLEKKLSYFRS